MQHNYKDFQVGNWAIYLPEGNYCTIKSLQPVILEGACLQPHVCTLDEIASIKITEDKLQVCGFTAEYPRFTKNFKDEVLITIMYSISGAHTLYKNGQEVCKVQYIHEVQNAYFNITYECLGGNLYGVREG